VVLESHCLLTRVGGVYSEWHASQRSNARRVLRGAAPHRHKAYGSVRSVPRILLRCRDEETGGLGDHVRGLLFALRVARCA